MFKNIFMILGMELRILHMLGKISTTQLYSKTF